MTKSVLMVGFHPDTVNYDKWPGLTPEGLRGALQADQDKLRDRGFEADIGFILKDGTAADSLAQTLGRKDYDVVMIGAGVRRDDDHFLIFEELVNTVHEHAPKARIAFNTGPQDSEAAVLRWA